MVEMSGQKYVIVFFVGREMCISPHKKHNLSLYNKPYVVALPQGSKFSTWDVEGQLIIVQKAGDNQVHSYIHQWALAVHVWQEHTPLITKFLGPPNCLLLVLDIKFFELNHRSFTPSEYWYSCFRN